MKARFFPWRLFQKFALVLFVLINFVFVLALAVGSVIYDFSFYRIETLWLFLSFLVVSILLSLLFAYRFSMPLRRVILKALRLANKKHLLQFADQDEDADALFENEPGEYFELEQALDKIRKKMKKRRLELAHEREESKALMRSLEEAVVSVGREGRLNYFNSRFATLFMAADLVRSQNGPDLLINHVFRDPEVLKRIDLSLNSGTVERCQLRLPTLLENQGRYFSITVSPLREEKTREIYGALMLFHDISELKKAEQIRIEFVENASHELRTPLTSMKGYVETAREDLGAGRYEMLPQFLSIISRSVDRLNELVVDMLTISSLENNSGLEITVVHPEIITQDVFEQLGPLASEKKIMLKTINEAEPFKADAILIERVLSNLVGNAIKYIPEGRQIEVRWSVDRQNKKVILKVKDNGPGIGEEHLGRLFERFYRVDRARNRNDGGTGLGLAIVKHIVQSHGGDVRVASQRGEGAEFICEFPYRP